ncbi:hypothetical protein B0T10DRAFT_200850 [Thelonectria olida]|uniref:Uncharacterized protein n=1 Tax=Thelonectria olida TaxID=1576542 RepID=A0A9P8VU39_9HYPO|nr:hypothetical protein B0T10DRAFT_200850 [Thelonectria olida]
MTEKQKAKIRDGNRSTSRRGIIAMVRNYEDHGIQASASYRQTGLQVSSENQMLRAMIQRAGISDHETTHYLRTAPPLSREVLDSYPYEERDPLEAQADRQAFAIVPQPPNEPDLSQARVSRRPQTWDGTNAGAQQSRPEGSSAVIGQHQHQHQSAAQGGMRQVFDEDNDQQLPYAGDSGYQSTNEDGNRGNRSLQLTNEHTSELHHGNGGFQFQSTNGHISLPPPHYGGRAPVSFPTIPAMTKTSTLEASSNFHRTMDKVAISTPAPKASTPEASRPITEKAADNTPPTGTRAALRASTEAITISSSTAPTIKPPSQTTTITPLTWQLMITSTTKWTISSPTWMRMSLTGAWTSSSGWSNPEYQG